VTNVPLDQLTFARLAELLRSQFQVQTGRASAPPARFFRAVETP